jgi:cyanophycin synthetase
MDILFSIAFSGPSHWSSRRVLETHIKDPSDHNDDYARLDEQIRREFCSLQNVESPGEVNGELEFRNRVDRVAYLARALQQTAGVTSSVLNLDYEVSDFPASKLASSHDDRQCTSVVAIEFEEEALARECITSAMRIVELILIGESVDWVVEKRRLVELADDVRLGPSSRAILRAASQREVPYYRMNCGSLVQLGEGVFQRRIWTAETDATSAIAESIAKDKHFTRTLLASAGVPVAKGRLVTDAADAWNAAQEIGLPVVVKPRDANHARGISLDLRDKNSIYNAYDWAKVDGETEEVMVEQYIEGEHHRLLVVGDQMVAAAKGQREFVIGNGRDTIEELVAEVNRDPRRGENYTDQLGVLKLDPAALIELKKQNVTPETVLESGQQILVRHVGDLIEDVTDRVHPTTAATAVLAAKVVGLDVAGMDLVARDISQPLSDQRGCIIEVNAGPSLAHHVEPLIGKPQPVGDAILNLLFQHDLEEADARFDKLSKCGKIPITLVVTRDDKSMTAQELEQYWTEQGEYVGVVDHQSIRCGGQFIGPIESLDTIQMSSVCSLLMHPLMTKMIVECSSECILKLGIPVPRADFLVIELESLISEDGNAPARELKNTRVLRACRNALTSTSVVITKSPAIAESVQHQAEKEFEAIVKGIPPERLQSYESIFQSA